jgi:hypothetical protein
MQKVRPQNQEVLTIIIAHPSQRIVPTKQKVLPLTCTLLFCLARMISSSSRRLIGRVAGSAALSGPARNSSFAAMEVAPASSAVVPEPTGKQLRILALRRAIPMVGFGMFFHLEPNTEFSHMRVSAFGNNVHAAVSCILLTALYFFCTQGSWIT